MKNYITPKLLLLKLVHSKAYAAIMVSACLYAQSNSTHAELHIKLQQPTWEFLLHNQPQPTTQLSTQAQLASSESHFASKIQPLLAAQKYDAVLKAFNERDIKNDSAALRQLRGQILLSMQRTKEAEQALLAAIELMPNLALAHRSLSMVYMVEKNYAAASKHLRKTIELGVADAQVYGQLAYVNLQQGQAASAVAGYQYALLLDSDNQQWQQGLLYALINSQAFDQAQALLEDMLQANPKDTNLWLQRGQIALKQQRPQQALSSLETALVLGENNADNIATLAQLHIQSGSANRAVTLLANNITKMVANNNKIEVIDQVCAWLAYQQQWQQLANLTQALQKSTNNIPAHYRSRFAVYAAQVAQSNGKTKHATKLLEEAVNNDPSNGEALLTLANILRSQQRTQRASLYYIRAEALADYKERALLGRAQLEIDANNYPEALRLLRLVAQLNPARTDVLANIQSLENLVRNRS